MRTHYPTWSISGAATRLICMLGLSFALTPAAAQAQSCKQPVYVIAHRCNDPGDPANAVNTEKVNAIEADFKWGRPTVGADDRWTVEHDTWVNVTSTQLDDWLDEVSKETKNPQSGLALIVLDIKTPYGPIENLYHRVRNKLGSDINLMFSVGSVKGGTDNLGRLKDLLNDDPRAGAAIDFLTGDENQKEVEAFFKTIGMKRYWFGDGIFGATTVFDAVEKNVADGMALRDTELNCSAFHGVYTWTYEERDKIKWYLNQGVNGIIVNTNACYQFVLEAGVDVITTAEEVVDWAKQASGRKFATKADNPFDMRPQITCPPNVTVECAAPGGTPVIHPSLSGFNNTATCSSGYCAPLELTDDAPLFSYPLGYTNVTFTATAPMVGSCTPTRSCNASVTVQDTTAPALNCPADMFLDPISLNGNPVGFQVPVSDTCDPQVAVVCSHPPGSTFAMGTTTPVTCTATDSSTNATTCGFNVKVYTPQEVVENLKAKVQLTGELNTGQINGLTTLLDALLASIQGNQTGSICGQLDGFIAKVNNWISQGHITAASGQPLITSANNLKQTYNCF